MDDLTKTALAAGTYVTFTGGSCKRNPGPGGAAMRLYVPNGGTVEKTRKSSNTTNNIAEMVAVIAALQSTPAGASVIVCLDSAYIKDGFEKYLGDWVKRGWRKSNGGEVANIDHWKQIIDLAATRTVTFHKLKAHSGHPDNEHVDRLASDTAKKVAKSAFCV